MTMMDQSRPASLNEGRCKRVKYHVLGTNNIPSTQYMQRSCNTGITIPILALRVLSLREVNQFAQVIQSMYFKSIEELLNS